MPDRVPKKFKATTRLILGDSSNVPRTPADRDTQYLAECQEKVEKVKHEMSKFGGYLNKASAAENGVVRSGLF